MVRIGRWSSVTEEVVDEFLRIRVEVLAGDALEKPFGAVRQSVIDSAILRGHAGPA